MKNINRLFPEVYDRIINGRDLTECDLQKGYIVANDPDDEILSKVKQALQYDDLKAKGLVHEVRIDESWSVALRRDRETGDPRKCWVRLIQAANQVCEGLLVLEVSNIRMFKFCWSLKQLAKQECPLEGNVDFRGYVLMVIRGHTWDDVKKHAMEHDQGQFDAMLQFYDIFRN